MKILIKFLLSIPLVLAANDLDLLYDDSQVAIIEINMDPEGLIWMYDHVQSDSMHLSTVHFSNAFIDETIENVGFRTQGQYLPRCPEKIIQALLSIRLNRDANFMIVEKLNLNGEHNDPSIIRSKIAWDHYRKTGMATTRAAHCAVYINDVYYGTLHLHRTYR